MGPTMIWHTYKKNHRSLLRGQYYCAQRLIMMELFNQFYKKPPLQIFHWALNTPLIINSYFSKGSLSGAANVSWIYISLINTLNTKSTKNFKDNKAPVKVVRQYSKRVANHSNMLDRKLFKFSFDISVKILKMFKKTKIPPIYCYEISDDNISSIVASFL